MTTAAAVSPLLSGQQPLRRGVWIDPALSSIRKSGWRKIHLDFHNSQHVERMGDRFNADEFGDTLLRAHVDSVVVFAKDMHGYFYYPSKIGPVHPALRFDLLGEQVRACRQRKIAVYGYHCTTWDNYLAEQHQEWLVLKRDRTTYLPKFDETPRWTALCIARDGFVSMMEKHTREFMSRYELDGAWFDMPYPINGECFCSECLRQIRASGRDPLDRRVQREHKQELEIRFLKRLYTAVQEVRPGAEVDFNNQACYGLGDRKKWMSSIDLEALPSAAQWGYYFFPLVTRYARSFGLRTYGMTGRFKASWADFGGLKLPDQLAVECASIVANGARCDIGDQMPPTGRLDPAVYHVIGKVYAQIKSLEPYLDGAVPVIEAAVLAQGLPIERVGGDTLLGLTKLLMECRVQFDVVEPDAQWQRYGLLVLPEDLSVDSRLAKRLLAYVAGGGRLIACHTSGVLASSDESWLQGFSFAGISPFKPAYMIPKQDFTAGIPTYEYALYGGASQWRAPSSAKVVAQLGQPSFQRSPERYTSHAQSPFDHETEYAVVAVSGGVALFAFPLGASYHSEGYWVYRAAVRHVLRDMLPQPIVMSNAPVSTEIAVTWQGGSSPRYLVHVVNWSANRGTPRHPVFHEDPIPLTGVSVRLNLPVKGASARAVVSGASIPVRVVAGGAEVDLPSVRIHEVVAFDC